MRKLPWIILVAAVISTVALSCSRRARVIPVRKMEKIYREMFLADQWLADNHPKRRMADTTWFYEPIFEKYGYDTEDYRASVDHYLSDPKRYAEMLGRVVKDLQAESDAINRQVEKREKMKARADSIAYAMKTYAPDDLVYYGLEYKFVTEYLIGQTTYDEMFSRLEIAIHQFAKRQMTWFRGMERRGFKINWIDATLPMEQKIAKILELSQLEN